MAITQRLSRLEHRLTAGPTSGPCPACRGRFASTLVHVDLDGVETITSDNRCPVCGSPDALRIVFQIVPNGLEDDLDGR